MKIRVMVLMMAAAASSWAQSVTALRAQGASVEQNDAGTNGGYLVFRPVTYNPYGGAACNDEWSNPVQLPIAASPTVSFGANDLLLWNSLSPSVPFTVGSGLVAPRQFDTVGAAGPCGSPLPVNLLYGLNTNGYLFAQGGHATDNPLFNSMQSLQGGMLAGSFTAAIYYPPGTTTTTGLMGAGSVSISGTAVTLLSGDPFVGGQDSPVAGQAAGFWIGSTSARCGTCAAYTVASIADATHLTLTAVPSLTGTQSFHVAIGLYLGGHVDVGHSVGAPASGALSATNNPYTLGEGAVAGQLYFEDGNSVYPTYLPCLRVFSGTSFGCAGDVSEVYNSFADMASSPSTTAAVQTHSGTFIIWGSGDAQFQTVKATSTFNSLATGTTAALQQSSGTFVITGAGNAAFQSIALTNGITVDSGAFGLSGSGALTASSAVAPIFNCSATGASHCVQQASGTFLITGAGDAAFQSVALTNGLTVDSGAYGLTGSGILSVASCTGCGGGVSSWNTRTGAVTLLAADVAAVEQDLRPSASPSFAAATAVTFNCSATSTTFCITQASGTWGVTGAGNAAFQSVALTNGLTVDSGAFGLSGSGVLSVASCTGCGGGVSSWNTRTGAVTLSAADVAAVEQDLRTSASPSFAAATAVTFNCSATSTTFCITQASGTWGVTGAGNAAFQSVALTNGLTVDSGAYGLSGSGALSVASCSGCGGVTGLVSSGNGLSFSGPTGGVVASLAQDISTSASPTFSAVIASTFFNCAATGSSACIKQASGTWSINGQGDFAGQSLTTGANNGSAATAGSGLVVSKSGASTSAQFWDAGGHCDVGTGVASPGIACSSDARLKFDVAPVLSGLAQVLELRPVTYRWIGTGSAAVGFIAQDVQRVLPGLVMQPEDSRYLMLSQEGMIPYLVRAVQELQGEIEGLRSR